MQTFENGFLPCKSASVIPPAMSCSGWRAALAPLSLAFLQGWLPCVSL